jgi:hypothetical protein
VEAVVEMETAVEAGVMVMTGMAKVEVAVTMGTVRATLLS